MATKQIPSNAQAKFLARIWSGWDEPTIEVMTRHRDNREPYVEATMAACVRRGWFTPTGETVTRNGFDYAIHMLNDTGIDAMEDYFREARYRRGRAA